MARFCLVEQCEAILAMDILLVNPLFLREDPVEARLMTPYFPLGLLYVAAMVREAGYRVAIFDAMFAEDDDEFVQALERHRPSVVGLGVLATVRKAALRLAELAKKHGAVVVAGGADPTARPKAYLEGHAGRGPVVDVVVRGEGEETILELLPVLLQHGVDPAALSGVDGVCRGRV